MKKFHVGDQIIVKDSKSWLDGMIATYVTSNTEIHIIQYGKWQYSVADQFLHLYNEDTFFAESKDIADQAMAKHGEFASLHEAYAVLLEEVDELWDEVKKKEELRDKENIRLELLQIAAMAYKASRIL